MVQGPQRGLFELSFTTPAECADRLAMGQAEIGIVPSVELERLKLDILPGAGIACRGPIRSILLISKVAPENIRVLAADAGSRTSVVLAQLILANRYAVRPRLLSRPPELTAMLEEADAAVIIGDPALRLEPASLAYFTLDLGQEWLELTGLPMVFAVWAARREYVTAELIAAFQDSCRFGRQHLEDIVRAEASRRGIPEALARHYLHNLLINELGEQEYRGLKVFLERARQLGRRG